MIRSAVYTTLAVSKAAFSDLHRTVWSQYRPAPPRTLNLLVNDICNSRCVMCNIWRQKRDQELTVDQLAQVLGDKLFAGICHVGVSGGEPTLRKDLPEIFEAICRTLPKITGASIITNAIRSDDVIGRVENVAEVCRSQEVDFSLMVSLDGIGEVHDTVRGREGNFDSAVDVIRHFRDQTDIPLLIGCTITKNNVWDVDDVLDFCRDNHVYGRFRVAEFIKRLYNLGQTTVIRNFDDDEAYHLAAFFKKLELDYETSHTIRRTYRNIQQMLLGAPRRMGCPYQSRAVTLDCRGNLLYCSVKSKVLGGALRQSAARLYWGHIAERRRILGEDCSGCIHDYHAPVTAAQLLDDLNQRLWRKVITLGHVRRLDQLLPTLPRRHPTLRCKHVFITGWYGTETVGDKAILGHIMRHYRKLDSATRFSISSLHPFVTRRTIAELGLAAEVVPVYSYRFVTTAASADEVVMGGGPLMGINSLAIPWWAFAIARRVQGKTTVFGCGLGPLREPRHLNAVRAILMLADEIALRDTASVEWARQLTGRTDISCTGDPAVHYVRHVANTCTAPEPQPVLACFLRRWPVHYRGELDVEQFESVREQFEANLAQGIKQIANQHGLTPVLYPMHCFVDGEDDRDFNRRFARDYLSDINVAVERKPSSVASIVHAMRGAQLNLCMRFHSVVFAHTLGADYLGIDYTNGGKISAFLHDQGASERAIGLCEVVDGGAEVLLARVERLTALRQRGMPREVAA